MALVIREGVGFSVLEIVEGRSRPLLHRAAEVAEGRWYGLQVAMRGAQFGFHLDGERLLEARLGEAPASGGVGIFRGVGAGAAFRKLRLEAGSRSETIAFDVEDTSPLVGLLHRADPEVRHRAHDARCLVQRVSLGEDHRTSLIVPPGSEIAIPLEQTKGGTLRYEIGVLGVPQDRGDGASRLHVELRSEQGDPARLETHYLSSEAAHRVWEPFRVELPASTRQSDLLVFRNEPVGATGGAHVAIANPSLTSRDASDERPNLVLVVVDTLRADHLGAYGNERNVSPFVDRLASRSVLFENAHAQSSWTKTSMASLLTSTHPETNGVRGVTDRLSDDVVTFAEVLRDAGYHTAAVQTNPWIQPRAGLAQGFREFQWLPAPARASRVNERALEIVSRRGSGPFLLYLHYMDVHHPYLPPASYRRFGANPGDLYDAAIRHLDDQLAALHESLEARGLATKTIFVLASDHGEEFGEHGGSFHGGTLYREALHVPLVISWPGRLPASRRVRGPVRNLDLAPTLLDLMGIPAPASFQGASLEGAIDAAEAGSERADFVLAQVGRNDIRPDADLVSIASREWKYIKDRAGAERRLFHIASDPLEQRDVSTTHAALAEELDRRVEELLAGYREAFRPSDGAGLDAATRERLQSLGYLQDTAGRPEGASRDSLEQ